MRLSAGGKRGFSRRGKYLRVAPKNDIISSELGKLKNKSCNSQKIIKKATKRLAKEP
jgi:hypothetical protein